MADQAQPTRTPNDGPCSAGCDKPAFARGLCHRCYRAIPASEIKPYRLRAPEERFWSKVDRRGLDECWPWQGARSGGYGNFHISRERGYVPAHRFAWELVNGPIPDGLVACHKCDVRRCVNPAHLFLGTTRDNVQDMHAKGRASTTHERSRKLSEQSVREMRRRLAAGESLTSLATAFGVSAVTVSNVKTGRTWRHIEEAL